MAEKYVRCNSHCKYPAYDKEEVDNLLKEKTDIADMEAMDNKKQNIVLSGTEDPASDLGTDGDIYLKYE